MHYTRHAVHETLYAREFQKWGIEERKQGEVLSTSASSPVGASEILGQTPPIPSVYIVFRAKPIILCSVLAWSDRVRVNDLFMDPVRPVPTCPDGHLGTF